MTNSFSGLKKLRKYYTVAVYLQQQFLFIMAQFYEYEKIAECFLINPGTRLVICAPR
jgi:hypothetical protein